ncbi:alpha/beta hydrolase [Peribacillus cavernae]|uniref:Alpha/beta hydrolase n=1 Tax=Peribacillus cavernae TaxID=1674310 RepID=A0A433HX41_9BACI|nr:alpha/beta hydrolase [Peribacillus cavernae]MDQ0218055.1 pimeloyl-ACP methyl ester carboxylesterase [Peribacillus cavernae]RUQ32784.1 alpha/beta hydrolase [Peribacillus cavernae]
MKMYVKELGNRNIQIADYPGEKGTIIAIHGLTGTHKNMHYYAELLKGEYRVIAVDLRGRGNSSELDEHTSIFKHAEDVIDLITELKIENPILIGHSMGAFISSIIASKLETVKGLVLLDGAATMSDQQRDIVKPSLGRLSKRYESKESYIEEVKGIYNRLGVEWTPVLQDAVEYEIREAGDKWEHKSTEYKVLEDFESFYSYIPKTVCSKVTCNTLLVYAKGEIGTLPPLFFENAYDDTKKYTEHIETIISDCNHYTMVFENREEINQSIKTFLMRI